MPASSLGPDILFCPGDRPDRFEKAADRASAVILDLEDAVEPEGKVAAREGVEGALSWLPRDRTIVRINPLSSDWGRADVDSLGAAGARVLMLPKAEGVEELQELGSFEVIALCETPAGVLAAGAMANEENCEALMWGGEDLIASIGGRRSRDETGAYLSVVTQVRNTILLEAAAAGIAAWDGTFLLLDDLDGLRAECEEAVAMGFRAKVAVHPSQTPVIRAAFVPDAEAQARAREILAIARRSKGVFRYQDQMIDGPLIAQAEVLLAAVEDRLEKADR